jgi:hypothetical protein
MGRDCAQTRWACRTGRRPRRPRSRYATRRERRVHCRKHDGGVSRNRENPRRSRAGSPPVPSLASVSGEKFDRRVLRIQSWRALRATLIRPRLPKDGHGRGWLECPPYESVLHRVDAIAARRRMGRWTAWARMPRKLAHRPAR